ncbi:assimilatory sulfite reductase (NADPH) flavoprotein subunit [Caviibacterium pharyngocola]|uniref:Sulfite reductase [NADPH] flavoprotein alpha-component n=1 Tax=Caviibacterium pharyngocola TaxID=28159 RepID=A0A2M8RZ91_9PAST|nr:assimilatory sulfite reductase (NADPH) flavoprotein subunit [Caviibacterium pharyngocola]PJG84188.1 sulfite reductase subunit alpha [Caviibacterium pharyngocola]
MTNTTTFPLNAEAAALVEQLDNLQLAWLSGYCWAKAKGVAAENFAVAAQSTAPQVAAPLAVTVLSVSQTGNAKSVAADLAEGLKQAGINVTLTSASQYKAKNIADERLLLLVTSTQGEGEPPEEGVVLYKFLHGKKAPKLDQLEFAVFGLGDTSYPNFCQAGKDFDQRLAELGGKRLADRVDADLDFKPTAEQWIASIVETVKQKAATATVATQSAVVSGAENSPTESRYNKENPFPATLLTNQKITARQAEKDVRHIELDLADSGLTYEVGDALGVWFDNDPELVAEILASLGLSGDEEVNAQGKTLPIRTALLSHFELTQATPVFVKAYAELAKKKKLTTLVGNAQKLADYVGSTPIADVLKDFPAKLGAQQFVDLLRPLTPRLYSISSAQAEAGDEVHLSVGVVRFEHNGKTRSGAASSYLADRVEEDGKVRVFVERNPHFRLPQDASKPIIMIGSGTGIAPFRAFVQQRAAEGAEGKNWLIFGNQHFTQDFLYQTEWQQFAKDGFLHKYDFAWSRDQAEKVYVQHKIRQQATALWQWLQDGAYVYVCGDAGRMAKDVENALLDVIEQEGKLTRDDAEEYLNGLREDKRYQRDVY